MLSALLTAFTRGKGTRREKYTGRDTYKFSESEIRLIYWYLSAAQIDMLLPLTLQHMRFARWELKYGLRTSSGVQIRETGLQLRLARRRAGHLVWTSGSS